MKNSIKLFGIIALAAVIGFAFITCDDGGATHTHSYSTTWSSNATQHWHECSCGDKADAANHTGDPCSDCGYSSGGDAVISIKAIAGVTKPVQGATPVTAITANDQYTGTVTWNHSPATFDYATEYVATITLIAKSGYTLLGVTANFFTVAGADLVTNAANSGVVTATFPQTEDDPSLLHLEGDVTISPNNDNNNVVTINTELTANYSGTETVSLSYQWEKDGEDVGTNSNKYTPDAAGTYTVTVRAEGYNPKTSETVTVVYIVTFNADNGTANTTQTVTEGGKATKPADPSKAIPQGLYAGTSPICTFVEWQKDGTAYDFNTPVTGNITLTAQWIVPSATPIDVSGQTGANIIAKSVAYINADTSGATEYTLVLGEDVNSVATITHNKNGVTLTITSAGSDEVKISKGNTANGTVFTVGGVFETMSSAKLIIDGNVTLQGKTNGVGGATSNNNNAVIRVQYGGRLELKGNAKITGNTSSAQGGGIYAGGGTNNAGRVTVTMSGNAEISGNAITSYSGGGVHIGSYCDFTMYDNAAIKNNSVNYTIVNTSRTFGGGVAMSGQYIIFTMNGGEISGNSASGRYVSGGGVDIPSFDSCQFIVASDTVKRNIKNNTVTTNTEDGTAAGAQVQKRADGVFTVGGVAQGTAGTAQGWDSWD